ncbi:hypothetical protein OsJ_05356 [Oryza sativa Japonica Group]|uniref:Uncharacterized protein n=1 Tax=Oryza sativa subsp. japonica TaxID=39947 RepID=B9F2P5_ORYSJ|nr:hypothetical protein OsJ_05356 [Oryza sativa Japonica Group]
MDVVPGRVMLRAFYDDVDMVPRTIVIKQIPNQGGQGESWTFSVFVLNNDFAGIQAPDEDLPPMGALDPDLENNHSNGPVQEEHLDNHAGGWGDWEQQGENQDQHVIGDSGVSQQNQNQNQNSDSNGNMQIVPFVPLVDPALEVVFTVAEEGPLYFISDETQGRIQEFFLRKELLEKLVNSLSSSFIPGLVTPSAPFSQLVLPKRKLSKDISIPR